MRRRVVLLAGLLVILSVSLFSSHLRAQGQETPSQEIGTESDESGVAKWKLINTGIFVLVLGYFIIKTGPSFFNARSLEIQKAIKDATGLKIEADFRYSEIDKKMAGLSSEVAKLRAQAKAEMQREHERILRETKEEAARIQLNGEAEIQAMQADGERQVRLHTAQLAVGLAERRLQTYFAEGRVMDDMSDFVNLVERGKN